MSVRSWPLIAELEPPPPRVLTAKNVLGCWTGRMARGPRIRGTGARFPRFVASVTVASAVQSRCSDEAHAMKAAHGEAPRPSGSQGVR